MYSKPIYVEMKKWIFKLLVLASLVANYKYILHNHWNILLIKNVFCVFLTKIYKTGIILYIEEILIKNIYLFIRMSARMEVFVRMESMTTLVSVLWDMLAGWWACLMELLPYCLCDIKNFSSKHFQSFLLFLILFLLGFVSYR